jgi:hypothetical protein
LPRDPLISTRLLKRIQSRNRDLLVDAAIEAAMGIFFTALTSGVVFCVAWWVVLRVERRGFPGAGVPLGVTAVFLVVATIAAWRRVNPFANLKPKTDVQHLLVASGHVIDGYVHINRHTVAGLSLILMGGPVNLLSAVETTLQRLPSDPELIDRAVDILGACRPDCEMKQTDSSIKALVLLRRLNLVSISRHNDALKIRPTESGQKVIGATGSRSV